MIIPFRPVVLELGIIDVTSLSVIRRWRQQDGMSIRERAPDGAVVQYEPEIPCERFYGAPVYCPVQPEQNGLLRTDADELADP